MDQDIYFKVIELIIVIISALIGRYLVPYLKTKIDVSKLSTILSYIDAFVIFAEKTIQGEKMGEERMKKVVEMVSKKAKEIGIKLSEDEIEALVEEAYKNIIGGSSTEA